MSDNMRTSDGQLLRRVWKYVRVDRYLILMSLFLIPVVMGLGLLQPWLLKLGIDRFILAGNLAGLAELAWWFLGVVLLRYLLESGYTLILAQVGQNTILRLRKSVFEHLLDLPQAFFDRNPAGALLTRATSDIESMGESLSAGVITILLDLLMVTGILLIMFSMNWQLTLALLLVAPPLLWILKVLRDQIRRCFVIIRESLAAVNAYLAERLSGLQIVQLFNHHEASIERFTHLNQTYRDATVRSNVFDAMMYAIVDGVGTICIALMLWVATSGWTTAVSLGLLVAFIDYLQRLLRPLQEFSGKIAIIQRATTALEKILWLLEQPTRESGDKGKKEELQGRVEVEKVRFAYKEGEDVLHGVSWSVNPGEVVALVGSTGCGKTTMVRLLARVYDGYRGSIRLDGQEVAEMDRKVLARSIAMVSQDIQLFPESVSFNIDLGNPSISQQQLKEAADLVHVTPFVCELDDGWTHILREQGANLSVGQGQLLTFARTMAYDPAVVILDEATASIDPETEALVQDAISRILERKTVIVIAHRLSTITSADRILVMDRGRVVEQGNHEELLQLNGRYAELYNKGFAKT
jgi:ATP-binding cassette subfamily B protein